MKTQELLATITGRRTVPNVFVGGSSIGGGDETVSLLRLGTLEDLLLKAGAI
jgi:glutaredoxin 3